jgi:hypothetical protein
MVVAAIVVTPLGRVTVTAGIAVVIAGDVTVVAGWVSGTVTVVVLAQAPATRTPRMSNTDNTFNVPVFIYFTSFEFNCGKSIQPNRLKYCFFCMSPPSFIPGI